MRWRPAAVGQRARLWADFASKKLNQPVVVDNKPGAGGILAAQQVIGKPPDGCTIYPAGTIVDGPEPLHLQVPAL